MFFIYFYLIAWSRRIVNNTSVLGLSYFLIWAKKKESEILCLLWFSLHLQILYLQMKSLKKTTSGPYVCLSIYKNGYFEDTHCLMRKKSRSSHRRCSLKKAVKEILQNSHENTFAGVSYLKETPSQVFSWEFCKILRTPPLKNTSGRLLLKSNSFVNIFCSHLSVFPNKSCRIRPIKLKTVMLYQMTNSFW